jgi:hypothetical protein
MWGFCEENRGYHREYNGDVMEISWEYDIYIYPIGSMYAIYGKMVPINIPQM